VPVKLKLNNLSEVVKMDENDPGPKTKIYFQKTKDGKKLLRQVMKRYIPDQIIEGNKQGFSAPDASWFKGESIEYVKRRLFNSKAIIYDYLDYSAIHSLVNQHLDGTTNRRLLIWSLLNFDHWCRTYIQDK
jgi:asparagine synthase (glutamine-hydrolysing)